VLTRLLIALSVSSSNLLALIKHDESEEAGRGKSTGIKKIPEKKNSKEERSLVIVQEGRGKSTG
jgi:hypothetical protein